MSATTSARIATAMLPVTLWLLGCDESSQPTTKARPTAVTSAAENDVEVAMNDGEVAVADDAVPASDAATGSDVAPTGADEADDEEGEDAPDAACAPPDSDLKPLQLLRFTFASGLEGKDPKDKIQVARPGQRVYAHFTMRNRSGRKRCMKLVFRVDGKKRTEVTLPIGKSWSWRTWAYNTIKSDDRGRLTLEVRDDQDRIILDKSLAIIAR